MTDIVPRLETKLTASLLTLDDAGGVFSGYASLFDRIDLSRDRVGRGAFRSSLARRGAAGIRMLWQHRAAEPIGVWLDLSEDAAGLRVQGRLTGAVARAEEARALIAAGAVDGLSIGFRVDKASTDPKTGIRDLVEIDLWEVSLVTFPMLPEARVARLDKGSIPDGARLAGLLRRAAGRVRSTNRKR